MSDATRTGEDQEHERFHRIKALHRRMHRNPTTSLITKIVVTLIGLAVIGAGVVMMVAPGPGIVGILVGLAILATEWDWAERWLTSAKERAESAAQKAKDMDPAVRRRRIILGFLVTVAVVGAAATYVAMYDWPGWSVAGWNQAQSFAAWLPELPGM